MKHSCLCMANLLISRSISSPSEVAFHHESLLYALQHANLSCASESTPVSAAVYSRGKVFYKSPVRSHKSLRSGRSSQCAGTSHDVVGT